MVPSEELTLAELDRKLAWVRADLAEYERLVERLEMSRRHLAELRSRVSKLEERVRRERRDVDELEGMSLTVLVVTLFGGDVEEQRAKETREWLAARMKYDEAREELAASEAEVTALERRVASLADPREDYHRLLADKSRWITENGAAEHDRLLHLAEREGVLRDALRELDEAIWAGDVARAALTGLLHALSKAQALGKLDMLGLSSNWVKFEHIDDAHRHASSANRALSRFQMELSDVQARHDAHLTLEIGGLATFADYFFDDLVSDWVVQCRINRSHNSAGIARTRVNRTQRALSRRRHEVVAELRLVRDRRSALGLEGA